jgi:hypothetical protein
MTTVNPDNTCASLIKHYPYREDALNYMLGMQNSLQEFVGQKRGNKFPKSEMTDFERAKEAIYFWGAATTEWFELVDAQEKYFSALYTHGPDHNITEAAKLEMQYEFIDIWHFMMNVFLYTGIDATEIKLGDYETEYAFNTIGEGWSELSFWTGKYINNLPYKHWKTYKDYQINDAELAVCFECAVGVFVKMGSMLGIDKELFFDLYCSKNEENIKRQEEAEKGYV